MIAAVVGATALPRFSRFCGNHWAGSLQTKSPWLCLCRNRWTV